MTIELGGKAGIVAADEMVCSYLASAASPTHARAGGPRRPLFQLVEDDASALVPQVALPHSPDNGVDIDQAVGLADRPAYIGACTGAKYHDLVAVADILRGAIPSRHPLMLAPASQEVYHRAVRDGIADC